MRLYALITLIALAAGPAFSGAWPREQGQIFLSFGTTISAPRAQSLIQLDQTYSFYLERGMRKDLTFGLDGTANGIGAYTAIAFLRAPILRRFEHSKFAVQLGLGTTGPGADKSPVVQIGLAWGRGFQTPLGPGWAAIDAQTQYLTQGGDLIGKLDATLGVKPWEKWMFMLQIQTGDYPGSDPYLRLAPAVAWGARPGRHIELGVQIGLSGDDQIGVKLHNWLEF
ncbi:hypothetical protein AIOL_004025 [Candidatus Rhodobacter oscarellae]|uniref:Uncharacterized protein n=1 Tax=Candidatus Rhodobacter oscarellae TaxID=1675527 RepID=A0A0J9EBG8_9RHOB|nr:hypothetical protein [Candidatus Rhodobacter lobularis]KMW59044.1 hypothetical protein AIOL_004025 [Candidatus Rhodobacter lobularis]